MIARDLVIQAKNKIEEVSNKEGLSGVASGFSKIDKLTAGWQSSELITIGARTGMGKTSFALSMAINISVNKNIPAFFFSLESSSEKVMYKLLSMETGLSIEKLRKSLLEKHEWELLNIKTKPLEKAPLFIDDTPAISIERMLLKIRDAVSSFGVEIIIIDYLQLIEIDDKNVKATNREQCVSIIVKKLKAISKELDIPIVLLSQLNRAIEDRLGTKRPILNDLRDSGAIEDDSDIVCFLYRPEYYKIDEWDDELRSPTEGQAEFIIAKNRNGGLENIRLKFINHLGKFDNLDDFDSPFDLVSKMNSATNNTFKTSPDQAFGSSFNDDDDNDVPF